MEPSSLLRLPPEVLVHICNYIDLEDDWEEDDEEEEDFGVTILNVRLSCKALQVAALDRWAAIYFRLRYVRVFDWRSLYSLGKLLAIEPFARRMKCVCLLPDSLPFMMNLPLLIKTLVDLKLASIPVRLENPRNPGTSDPVAMHSLLYAILSSGCKLIDIETTIRDFSMGPECLTVPGQMSFEDLAKDLETFAYDPFKDHDLDLDYGPDVVTTEIIARSRAPLVLLEAAPRLKKLILRCLNDRPAIGERLEGFVSEFLLANSFSCLRHIVLLVRHVNSSDVITLLRKAKDTLEHFYFCGILLSHSHRWTDILRQLQQCNRLRRLMMLDMVEAVNGDAFECKLRRSSALENEDGRGFYFGDEVQEVLARNIKEYEPKRSHVCQEWLWS